MDNKIKISIASDFSITPASRYKDEGPFSGEEFREDFLEPKFQEAIKENKKLEIILDGTIGYATSFLEEVFGGLARKHGVDLVLSTIELVSSEEEYLKDDILDYIKKAND